MTNNVMREDWDQRARENAMYYIVTDSAESEEVFRRSADKNIETLFAHIWPLLPGTESVLEIGCGIGRLLIPMAERFDKVLGCDVSPEMIRQAGDYLKGHDNISVWTNDGTTLEPLEDNELDLVYCYITFQHIPDRSIVINYMREAFRVLKPGGIFYYQVVVVSDSNQAMREYERKRELSTWVGYHWEQDDVVQATQSIGFEIVTSQRVEVATDYEFFFVTARKPQG